MSMELMCQWIGINPLTLSIEEKLLLEAELFTGVCVELIEYFEVKSKYQCGFCICQKEMECHMIEAKLIRCLINNILSSGDYTLTGIAYYTQVPEDILYEVAVGLNISPSAFLLRRIIGLHKSVRLDFYQKIMKKIINGHM